MRLGATFRASWGNDCCTLVLMSGKRGKGPTTPRPRGQVPQGQHFHWDLGHFTLPFSTSQLSALAPSWATGGALCLKCPRTPHSL